MKERRARTPFALILPVILTLALIGPTSAGVSFNAETRLTRYWDKGGWDNYPTLAQAENGSVWLVWQSKRNPTDFDLYYNLYNGTGWMYNWTKFRERPIFTHPSQDMTPWLLQAQDGKLWLFWSSNRTGDYDIFYITSSDSGQTWTTPNPAVTNSAKDTNPVAMQARNGTMWLVWHRELSGTSSAMYKTYNGTVWSPERTIDGVNSGHPYVLQMKDGKIWVFWDLLVDVDNFEIVYRVFNGTSWSNLNRLTTRSSYDDVDPAGVQDRNGTVWVFWSARTDTSQGDIHYVSSDDNGAHWTDIDSLTTDNMDDVQPCVARISDKKLWVAWSSNRDPVLQQYDLYYTTSNQILVHDVAIQSVIHSHDPIYPGETLPVTVTTVNLGDYAESYTVNCYANSSLIGTQNVNLAGSSSAVLNFAWSTSSFAPGIYVIKAVATTVPYESIVNTVDNTLSGGSVMLKIPGDVNSDRTVSSLDLELLQDAFGSLQGVPKWNAECDINLDNVVDAFDLRLLGKNYGKTI